MSIQQAQKQVNGSLSAQQRDDAAGALWERTLNLARATGKKLRYADTEELESVAASSLTVALMSFTGRYDLNAIWTYAAGVVERDIKDFIAKENRHTEFKKSYKR